MADKSTGREPEQKPELDFRHLPPRIMPDEMVVTKALVRVDCEADVGSVTEWQLRAGGA